MPIEHIAFRLLQIPILQQFFFLNSQPSSFSYCTTKIEKMAILGLFAINLQQWRKNVLENRKSLQADVQSATALSHVITDIVYKFLQWELKK